MTGEADEFITSMVKTWASAHNAWVDTMMQLVAKAVEAVDPDDDVIAANEKPVSVALTKVEQHLWVGPLHDAASGATILPSAVTVSPTTVPAYKAPAAGEKDITHAEVRVSVKVPDLSPSGVYEGKLYDGSSPKALLDVDVMISSSHK